MQTSMRCEMSGETLTDFPAATAREICQHFQISVEACELLHDDPAPRLAAKRLTKAGH